MDPGQVRWREELYRFLQRPAAKSTEAHERFSMKSSLELPEVPVVDKLASCQSRIEAISSAGGPRAEQRRHTIDDLSKGGRAANSHTIMKVKKGCKGSVRDPSAVDLLRMIMQRWRAAAVEARTAGSQAAHQQAKASGAGRGGLCVMERIGKMHGNAGHDRTVPLDRGEDGSQAEDTGRSGRFLRETRGAQAVTGLEDLRGWATQVKHLALEYMSESIDQKECQVLPPLMTQAGKDAARHLAGQGVLQPLLLEAYRAGCEAASTSLPKGAQPALDTLTSPERESNEDPQPEGAGGDAKTLLPEVVQGLRALEERTAASLERASEASRELERNLESASQIELAAIERLVDERVWQVREECEQRKIEAMERTEGELAAVKAALQATLARKDFETGRGDGATRPDPLEESGHRLLRDDRHPLSDVDSASSWFSETHTVQGLEELPQFKGPGRSPFQDQGGQPDSLQLELERVNKESEVLDRLAAQVSAWRIDTSQERARLESENKLLSSEVRELRLRAEVERTAQEKAALSQAVQPWAEAHDGLFRALQAVQALRRQLEKRCDARSLSPYMITPSAISLPSRLRQMHRDTRALVRGTGRSKHGCRTHTECLFAPQAGVHLVSPQVRF